MSLEDYVLYCETDKKRVWLGSARVGGPDTNDKEKIIGFVQNHRWCRSGVEVSTSENTCDMEWESN